MGQPVDPDATRPPATADTRVTTPVTKNTANEPVSKERQPTVWSKNRQVGRPALVRVATAYRRITPRLTQTLRFRNAVHVPPNVRFHR